MIELVFYLILIILVAGFAIRGKQNHPTSASFGRKILHIVAIGLSAIAPIRFPEIPIIQIIVVVAFPIVFALVWRGFLPDPKSGNRSWGIVYFVGIYLALLFLFEERPELIFYPMILLALADGFATIVGERYRPIRRIARDIDKTIAGSIAFFIFAFISLYWLPSFFLSQNKLLFDLGLAIQISLFLTVVEAILLRGTDNIWLPIAVVYFILLNEQLLVSEFALTWLFLFAAIAFVKRMKWLSASGAAAALVMALVLVTNRESPFWLLPPILFLMLGSLASRLPGPKAIRADGMRDAPRVWANGAIGLLCIAAFTLSTHTVFAIAGVAAFSAALSDTLSSEFGQRYGRQAFYLFGGKFVPVGLSGGVSVVGLLAGALASVLMGLLAYFILPNNTLVGATIVAISGVIGNVIDSLVGQFLQAKYRSPSVLVLSDFPSRKGELPAVGRASISNNVVNLIATFAAATLAFVLATIT